jgi:cytochrome c oxidase assembly factor CtaG/cytochrome c2
MALGVAFISPLNILSAALFSAHMLQHLLLILIAAPLLVLSKPIIPFLWALPRPARRAVGAWWKETKAVSVLWHGLTQPLLVWGLFALTIWVWHLPALYQAALEDALIHELEHISFLGAALLFWWILLQPTGHRRINYGGGILFTFTTALHSGALGALLTFARTPLYPIYRASVAPWNLTLLEDQQLAGLIMWIPASLIYVITALALFAYWLKTIEERVRRAEKKLPVHGLIILSLTFFLTSCALSDEAAGDAQVPTGDPDRGQAALRDYGCYTCHTIPGVPGAHTQVGPSLQDWANRAYIAGKLINTPNNLVQWIMDPQSIEAETAMPALDVTEQDAKDISAYLYTLRSAH